MHYKMKSVACLTELIIVFSYLNNKNKLFMCHIAYNVSSKNHYLAFVILISRDAAGLKTNFIRKPFLTYERGLTLFYF